VIGTIIRGYIALTTASLILEIKIEKVKRKNFPTLPLSIAIKRSISNRWANFQI
jgi:hypothetical protein